MNNQVDRKKLLEWLEDQKENSTMLYESIILSKIERAVLDGKFDPDTPPVPTIKPGDKGYKCCACRESSTSAEWNMETGAYLGIAMHFINLYGKDSDTFVCPKCGEEQPRHMVEVVE